LRCFVYTKTENELNPLYRENGTLVCTRYFYHC